MHATDLSVDPMFYDQSERIFYLKSTFGTWNGASWEIMSKDSPVIDAGDPFSDYSNEPMPNGGRINMGAYGNTPEASKDAPFEDVLFEDTSSEEALLEDSSSAGSSATSGPDPIAYPGETIILDGSEVQSTLKKVLLSIRNLSQTFANWWTGWKAEINTKNSKILEDSKVLGI